MGSRVLRQRDQLMAALAETKEEGELQRADEEPQGVRNFDSKCARYRSQHESAGDSKDIQENHVLQDRGVSDLEQQVTQQHHSKTEIDSEPGDDRYGSDQDSGNQRSLPWQATPRDRALALLGVVPVLLAVANVVEKIDRA